MTPTLDQEGDAATLGERLAGAAGAFGSRAVLRDLSSNVETSGNELAARSGAFRARLAKWRLSEGTVVGLLAPSGPDSLAMYIALLCEGLVPLELHPDWSGTLLERAVSYVDPSAIVVGPGSGPHKVESLAEQSARTEELGEGWRCVWRDGAEARADPGAVGLLFTGGTNGGLKAAVWSAAGLTHVLDEVIGYLEQDASTVTASALPWQHGYGKSVVLSSLLSGSTHCVLPRGPLSEPIPAALMRCGATSFSGVPLQYRLALRGSDTRGIGALRTACVAGGSLRADEIAVLSDTAPRTNLFIMYGLTEMTTRVSYLPPQQLRHRPSSCGRPLRGVEARVDPSSGELWVRGPNRMLGYWHKPDETAEVMSEDGWLRTGDVAELDEEGFLRIRGRIKNLVKRSGAIIYPGLVEEVARQAIGREVVAVSAPDPAGEDRLVLFVVGADPVEGGALRAAIRRRLGGAYLPDDVVPIEALPLSPTGKVRLDELRRLAAAL